MFPLLLVAAGLGLAGFARSRRGVRAPSGRRGSRVSAATCRLEPIAVARLTRETDILGWVGCTGRTTREVSQLARALQEQPAGAGLAERVMDEWTRIVQAQRCDLSVEQILASYNGSQEALEHWLACSGRNGRDVGTLAQQLQTSGQEALAEHVLDFWQASHGSADVCARSAEQLSIAEADQPLADAWARCTGRTQAQVNAFAARLERDRQSGRATEIRSAFASAQQARGRA